MIAVVFITAAFLVAVTVPHAVALWPLPTQISETNTALKLSADFQIRLAVHDPPSDLLGAISRTRSRLTTDHFQRLVLGRGAGDGHAVHAARTLSSLTLALSPASPVASIADETNRPTGLKDESYALSFAVGSPDAYLVANSTLGLFRGLATFEQLWYEFNGTKYTLQAPLQISDAPAFVRCPSSCFLLTLTYSTNSTIAVSLLIPPATSRPRMPYSFQLIMF